MSGIRRLSTGTILVALFLSFSFLPTRAEDCAPLKLLASIDLLPVTGEETFAVRASVNDAPVLLRLDTGEIFSELTATTADKRGLVRLNRKTTLVDLDGSNSDPARARSFGLGPLYAEWPDFGIVAGSDLQRIGLDGVLAPHLLMEDDVELDFIRRKLNLFSRDHCEGRVVYWPAPVVAVIDFNKSETGQIAIPVKLDGVLASALVDTGASFSAINAMSAKRLFRLEINKGAASGYGTRHAEFDPGMLHHRFGQLDLGGVVIANPRLAILADRSSAAIWNQAAGWRKDVLFSSTSDLIIGMDVLRHLHIYVAYKEKKLYITPASPAPAQASAAAAQPAATAH